jgi:hypothetical protein
MSESNKKPVAKEGKAVAKVKAVDKDEKPVVKAKLSIDKLS